MTRIVFAVLLALSSTFALQGRADEAAPASGGYSTTVPVADTSDAARDKAIAAAFTQVLSGLAPDTAPGADVLGQASGYVRNYKYRRAPDGNSLQLQVDFDPGSIQHLLQQMGASATAAASAPASAGSGGAAVPAGGSGTWWVEGIGSAQDFATLLATLRQSDQLQDVTPVAAQGGGVLLQLSWNAPLPDVLDALTGGGHFSAAAPHPGADASLHWSR